MGMASSRPHTTTSLTMADACLHPSCGLKNRRPESGPRGKRFHAFKSRLLGKRILAFPPTWEYSCVAVAHAARRHELRLAYSIDILLAFYVRARYRALTMAMTFVYRQLEGRNLA